MAQACTTRVFFALAALLLAGCSARGPHLRHASAPGLGGEREVADPNAPFTVPSGKPELRPREPLLDVNNVPGCSAGGLTLFESRAQSSGSRHTLQYTIRNSGAACRLSGFPAVALLRADGSVAGTVRIERVSSETLAATLTPGSSAAQETALDAPSPQVLLQTHGSAEFQLGWTTGPNCEQVSRIAIAAPGARRPMILPRPLVLCENRLLITAVAPGER